MNREMFCSNCGYKLNGNAKFCPQCGVKIAKKSKKAIVIVLSLLMFLIVAILLSLYFINKEELFVKKEQVISKDEKVNSNKEEVIYSSQVKSYKLYFGEENSYSETVSIYDERGNLCNFTQIDSSEETKSINYDIYYFFDESGYVMI